MKRGHDVSCPYKGLGEKADSQEWLSHRAKGYTQNVRSRIVTTAIFKEPTMFFKLPLLLALRVKEVDGAGVR